MKEAKLFLGLLHVIIYLTTGYSEIKSGLEVIPERAEITYQNEKYVANPSVTVRKYQRRGSYVVSVWGITKHTWANNVSVDIIFYEFLHNEYKRSFVEMHFKWCDLVNKDQLIGTVLRAVGIVCPTPRGPNGLFNATMSFPTFPNVFPFDKYKAEVTLKTEPSHEIIGQGNLYVHTKQVILNKMKAKG